MARARVHRVRRKKIHRVHFVRRGGVVIQDPDTLNNIETEDGDDFITEDGKKLKTEED